METREIKAALMLKGVTQAEIAKRLGVTKTWVSLVVNRKARSPRVQKAIADALNMPYKDIWEK